MKKLWYKLCVAALIFTLSAGFTMTASAYEESDITTATQQYLESWNQTDFSVDNGEIDEATVAKYKEWEALKTQLGTFSSITETKATPSEDGASTTCVVNATYEKGDLTFTVIYDNASVDGSIAAYGTAMYAAKDIAVLSGNGPDEKASISKALLNTVMAMAIVFTVLILISFIIYLLRFVPGLLEKKKNGTGAEEEIEAKLPPVQEMQTENLVKDEELVGVITAAIMAYEGSRTAAEGLVVRSIRRRH